jgi:hypothetical protein
VFEMSKSALSQLRVWQAHCVRLLCQQIRTTSLPLHEDRVVSAFGKIVEPFLCCCGWTLGCAEFVQVSLFCICIAPDRGRVAGRVYIGTIADGPRIQSTGSCFGKIRGSNTIGVAHGEHSIFVRHCRFVRPRRRFVLCPFL